MTTISLSFVVTGSQAPIGRNTLGQMTLSHDSLLSSCQETVPIPTISDLQRVLAPFPFKPYLAPGRPREMSVSFSHSMTYSLHPDTLGTRTLRHPIGRQSQFRHAHLVDALSGSLRSLLLVIITKHVLIIVSLFGTHLWLYILHWRGAHILTLCLHPKSSVRLKPLLLPLYLLYLFTLWLLTLPLPFATKVEGF